MAANSLNLVLMYILLSIIEAAYPTVSNFDTVGFDLLTLVFFVYAYLFVKGGKISKAKSTFSYFFAINLG